MTAADVRGRMRRPHGFGVDALQGGLTVWNRQPDPGVVITAEVLGVSAGTGQAPVRGSGVFLGGRLATSGDRVTTLEVTGELKELTVADGIHATGQDSDAAHLGSNAPDLSHLQIMSDHGTPVVTV